jgi:hypothetical protein
MIDCGFTAAAAIIVVKSDRDLSTDSEVKLWIGMLWVYMMYTYLPTVFFGDALDWDRDFMQNVFISNNYFICVIRTLLYQYIVMYRFSLVAIWDFPLPSRFIFNYFELFYFDPYCLGYFDDYLGEVHPEKSKISIILMKHLICMDLTQDE